MKVNYIINLMRPYVWSKQDGVFIRLIGAFFLWLLVALYLDNILPSENGISKSPLYFLNPGYWTGGGGIGAFGKIPLSLKIYTASLCNNFLVIQLYFLCFKY